ncbi:hypothetical protein PALB_35830 [Pseudoalteromonas luteoviolacea B = ATCC 29581]|nr:hypothetical protein PALB_35830 [Pseudoalteromonas luteoviolacea B = ATCC 29581]
MSREFSHFLSDILSEGQQTLDIARISAWLFDNIQQPTKLINIANTDWPDGQLPELAQSRSEDPLGDYPYLNYLDFPIYFKAIAKGFSIAANDATTHPDTSEFNGCYLQPNGITTMLDTVIFKNGVPHGVICCEGRGGKRLWNEMEIAYAEMLADCCSRRLLVKELSNLQNKLQQLAFQDALTGLHNRRFLMDVSRKEISRHLRSGEPLSIIMIDIDHFKRINDMYGHEIGDVVLKQFSDCCAKALRVEDCLSRLGGEEFLIILPATNIEDAVMVAERLRTEVKKLVVEHGPLSLNVTASFGVCEVDLQKPFSKALKRVDEAVYLAKDAGRNCVMLVTDAATS